MKLLVLLPAVAAAATSLLSTHANLDTMKATLRGIAEKANKEGKYIDDSTKSVVQSMLDNINSTLVDALYSDKGNAQTSLNIAFDAVELCSTNRGVAFSGVIAMAEMQSENAEGTFHLCKDESVPTIGFLQRDVPRDTPFDQRTHDYGYNFTREWNTEGNAHALGNTSHEQHSHTDMKTKCDALDALVRTFVPGTGSNKVIEQDQSTFCETPSAEDWTDLYRTNKLMVDVSYPWFSHMDTFEQSNAALYKEKRRLCHEARHRQQVRVEECNRLQHLFEQDYCDWTNAIDETCHTYQTCYSSTDATFVLEKANVEAIEAQYKRQQEALEHILCYGAQILVDATSQTDLSQCDGLTCVGCDALSITYTDVHAEITCDEEVTSSPCAGSWINTHYTTYFDSGSENPVDECNACSAPTFVDWTPAGDVP